MTSRWLLLLLRRLLPKGDAEVIVGDLAEEYAIRNDTRWLIGQCLRSLMALRLPALGFTLLAALIWFGSQFVLLMAIAAICGLVSVRGNDLRTIQLVVWAGQAIVSFAAGFVFAGKRSRTAAVLATLFLLYTAIQPLRSWETFGDALLNAAALIAGGWFYGRSLRAAQ